MYDKKQIRVSSLLGQIHSHVTKYQEFILPSRAKGLGSASIQKQEVCIAEGNRNIKLTTSQRLRLVYGEQETPAFKVYELNYEIIAYEQRLGYRGGNLYKACLAPDSRFKLSLLKPNVIAVESKLHVIIKVFSDEHLFIDQTMDEQTIINDPIYFNITEKGYYAIPGLGTIRVSIEE